MNIYKSFKPTENANRVVKELNSAVCTATFSSKEGVQRADLYTSVNSCSVLVSFGSCAPIHSTFVKTVSITFN